MEVIFFHIELNSLLFYLCTIMSSPGCQDVCSSCKQRFKRLSTHIALSASCADHYKRVPRFRTSRRIANRTESEEPSQYTTVPLQPRLHFNEPPFEMDKAAACFPDDFSRLDSAKDGHPLQENGASMYDNDTFAPAFDGFDDDFDVDKEPADTFVEPESGPDKSVLELYEKLLLLRANPLDLDKFSQEENVQIQLLQLLNELRAPLNAFTAVLNWAAKANDCGYFFKVGVQPSREKMIQKLYARYNMKGLIPKEKQLYLPYSKRTVSMVYFDASEVFASLLSCPILNKDELYMFHDKQDPFAKPCVASDLGDINTGRCYLKTYDALVKRKGVDMILPSILAMDKTQVDTYGRLQMEPITISHGLLKHSARSKPTAMRILGYINHSAAHKPPPASKKWDCDTLPKGTVIAPAPLKPFSDVSWPTYLLNEMHMQIKFILEESGFIRLQEKGFYWKLQYAGKTFPVVMHPYIPFIIGDTEGHDRLCGHYTARFKTVKQLCRVCECPTLQSGYSKVNFPHRKPRVIDRLVRYRDLEGLKSISQHYLHNGFTGVRFGLHNDRGIFGACPGEMLHLISLGWFKYCLDAFSAQAGGPQSIGLKQYDRLCAIIGRRLTRQSDRDLPRTNFPKGFSSGANLMGHEIAGCLLVKLFALHTTAFQDIFPARKKAARKKDDNDSSSSDDELPPLSDDKHVSDWILVVSSLLQWHQWMKQSTIAKSKVRKSHFAVQWLMRHVAAVSPRASGMGTNTIKTHLVLHLCEDILDHGVPDNVNSAYAESAHIPLAKLTSRNTQKRAMSFTKQAAHRYIENLVISLAHSDVVGDPTKMSRSIPPLVGGLATITTKMQFAGRGYTISLCSKGVATFSWNRKMPGDDTERDCLPGRIMNHLATTCLHHLPDGVLPCWTEIVSSKEGYRYRAHPNIYDGRPWFDHAMVKWKGHMYPLPARLYAFLDLRGLPPGKSIDMRESKQPFIKAGVYALLHSFSAINDEREYPNSMIGEYSVDRLQPTYPPTLYLVDVDCIDAPTVGIPDVLGNKKGSSKEDRNHFFLFRRKKDWSVAWDSVINSVYSSRRNPSPEKAYEKGGSHLEESPPRKKRRSKNT